jgi:hypothetical protein
MSKVQEFINAVREGEGYGWMANHGWGLPKEELVVIIQEYDYAIYSARSYDNKNDVYNSIADELQERLVDEE